MKQIIVLGTYRSGTSMIAGVLHRLGVNMGDHLNFNDKNNPNGYYECQRSMFLSLSITKALHDQLFQKDGLVPSLSGVEASAASMAEGDHKLIAPTYEEKIKEYILSRETHPDNPDAIWGLKDPRILSFYRLYDKYLSNSYVIVINRSKTDIAISCANKVGTSVEEQIPIVEGFQKILNSTVTYLKKKKRKILELEYDECLANPEETVDKIVEFIGLTDHAKKFISNEHRCIHSLKTDKTTA